MHYKYSKTLFKPSANKIHINFEFVKIKFNCTVINIHFLKKFDSKALSKYRNEVDTEKRKSDCYFYVWTPI